MTQSKIFLGLQEVVKYLSSVFQISPCFGSQKALWLPPGFKHSPLVYHDSHLKVINIAKIKYASLQCSIP